MDLTHNPQPSDAETAAAAFGCLGVCVVLYLILDHFLGVTQ